jgi:hypothetical protein
MRLAISIAGVRPLGWLAACARAQRSACRGRAQHNCVARVLRGWRHARAARAARCWAWECTIIVRVSARGQANGSADGYLGARGARRQAEDKMRTVDCSLRVTKCYQNYFWKKSRFGRCSMEFCMPTGLLFSKPRHARSRVPRYTGALVRKSCSSHDSMLRRTVRAPRRPRLGSMSNVC